MTRGADVWAMPLSGARGVEECIFVCDRDYNCPHEASYIQNHIYFAKTTCALTLIFQGFGKICLNTKITEQ